MNTLGRPVVYHCMVYISGYFQYHHKLTFCWIYLVTYGMNSMNEMITPIKQPRKLEFDVFFCLGLLL